ncbi:MAG TPA: hypothetical protein VFE50_17755 [Cyclobacteriaceae bacterium]|nr:hypothetical protein [Cyclobacteriaceae bacterium]
MTSTRRSVILLGSIMLTSGAFIALLFFVSTYEKNDPTGFVREKPPHPALPHGAMDLGYNSFYLAGGDDEGFYLANSMVPTLLLRLDYSLSDTTHIRLKIPESIGVAQSVKIHVNQDKVYFMEGHRPIKMWGSTSDYVIDRITDTTTYFANSVPISPNLSIGTLYDNWDKKMVLAAKAVEKDISPAPEVLKKQIDGIFCVDGQLSYDYQTGTVAYVYFYRNEFIRLDTSLNVAFRGHTIDTISRVRLSVETIASSSDITMSSPPYTVNRLSCISGDWLYVNSALRASNDEEYTLEETHPIDVYNLTTGEYKHTIYIPKFRKAKLSSLRVFGDHLVVVMGNVVQTYMLRM